MPKAEPTPSERYCAAYWAWLRSETVFEPRAEDYGLLPIDGEVLRRQCDAEIDHPRRLVSHRNKRGG